MKKTELIFPNTEMLSLFIIGCKPSNAEVKNNTLIALLSENQIHLACTSYQAFEIPAAMRMLPFA